MKKYMKYEIKGSYKFILGIMAVLLIAFTIFQWNLKGIAELNSPTSLAIEANASKGLLFGGAILTIFGAFLAAFFHIIGLFRKDLYEDRGYLTFTLPLSGNQIVGAKLMVAILWFISLGLVVAIYNLILGLLFLDGDFIGLIKEIFSMVNSGVLSLGIISGVSSILTLILIYFSIALSKVSIRNKRLGGIWFVIFLILNGLIGYITLKISSGIPYYLNLKNFQILHYYELSLNVFSPMNNGIGNIIILGTNYEAYINIFGVLSQIIISIVAFLGTGYLIERKIDL